jgi:hypothetical protein
MEEVQREVSRRLHLLPGLWEFILSLERMAMRCPDGHSRRDREDPRIPLLFKKATAAFTPPSNRTPLFVPVWCIRSANLMKHAEPLIGYPIFYFNRYFNCQSKLRGAGMGKSSAWRLCS